MRASASKSIAPGLAHRLPRGSYVCLAVRGQLTAARTGTPGYGVEFKVIEGEFAGRRLWRTWYLTPARDAMADTVAHFLRVLAP